MPADVVVGAVVTAEPAFQLAMRIGAAPGVARLDIRGIDGEFDLQPVRARHIKRDAVAVVGDATVDTIRLPAREQLVESLLRGFDGDRPPAAARRQDRPRFLVNVRIRELEESKGAAIAEREEGVAIIELAPEILVIG